MRVPRQPLRIPCHNWFDGTRHRSESVSLTVENGIIVAIDSTDQPTDPAFYWCPGFVNAHAHLELTDLLNRLPTGQPFPIWVDALRTATSLWQDSDYARSYGNGIAQCLAAGTTTVYDVGNRRAAPQNPALHLYAMPETIGITKATSPFHEPTVPHALFSCHPERITKALESCIAQDIPWSIHLAESAEEDALLRYGTGAFRTWLDSRIVDHPFTENGPGPWQRFASILAQVSNPEFAGLIIHGNHLSAQDVSSIAQRGHALVHCPESRAFFAHRLPNMEAWLDNQAAICIASDSLASAQNLDLRAQLRCAMSTTFANLSTRRITPEWLLSTITSQPGKLLGKRGRIAVGSIADLVCIRLPDHTAGDQVPSAVLDPNAQVVQTICAGTTCYTNGDYRQ